MFEVLLCLAVALSSCSDSGSGKPLKVADSDVVGTWESTFTSPAVKITLLISPDGSYSQTIVPTAGGQALSQIGKWRLDREESVIWLDDLLSYSADGWSQHSTSWWDVAESSLKKGTIAIIGGAYQDPDLWKEFKRKQ